MARKRDERSAKIKPQPCSTDGQSSSPPQGTTTAPPATTTAATTTPATTDSMVVHSTAPVPVFADLKEQLATLGLTLREIPGDGNCLFGALADQVDGSRASHGKHRMEVVKYMLQHRMHFEPFVEDEMDFGDHLKRLSEMGTFGGNECIVAFARIHKAQVVIHQVNTPLWRISGLEGQQGVMEVHISYHNGDHYNSVRRIGDHQCAPAGLTLLADLAATQPPCAHKMEAQLRSFTGCQDRDTLRDYLRRYDFNVSLACDALALHLREQSLSLAARRDRRPQLFAAAEPDAAKEAGPVSRLGV